MQAAYLKWHISGHLREKVVGICETEEFAKGTSDKSNLILIKMQEWLYWAIAEL